MQMLNYLAAIGTNVHHRPISRLVHAELLSCVGDERQKRLTFTIRPLLDVIQGRDVLPWDHQHMLWSRWLDVSESEKGLIFQHYVAGDCPICDSAENTVIHGR